MTLPRWLSVARICQVVGAVVIFLALVSAACSGMLAYRFYRDAQTQAARTTATEQAFVQFIVSRQDAALTEAFKARFLTPQK